MDIPIFKKHRYFITNKDKMLEEHYNVYRLLLFDKNCSYWFCIICEEYCRMIVGANFIFKLGN